MRTWLLAAACALFACDGDPRVKIPAPDVGTSATKPDGGGPTISKSHTVITDEKAKTPAGAQFTAPVDWTLMTDAPRVILRSPEKDVKIAIVDVPSAATAEAAVVTAWKAFQVDQDHKVKMSVPKPARDGWDEQKTVVYETSPNDKRVISAVANRKGVTWTVLLLDGAPAGIDKRGSQIDLVRSSLRPAGFERESFEGVKPHALDDALVKKIVDTIEAARKQSDVPGVAIALVQNGKVVFTGGLGVRALGKPETVDGNTRFMIASNTKQLTTLMLAKLVDEKKLQWEEPVTQADKSFVFADADFTKQLQIQHLVCACTGLPRQDYEWIFEFKNNSATTTMSALSKMEPTSKIGEIFQYSNHMAAAGGYVGAKVAYPGKELGAAYDEAMKTRVFAPLGMNDTTFDFASALKGNHASPHAVDIDGKTRVAKLDVDYAIVPVRPAGGAWSTANDLAKVLLMELGNGKLPDGKPYIGADPLLARRKRMVTLTDGIDYGMGLMIDTRNKVTVVHHGGDLAGYRSDMFFVPEGNVGGVILTNGDPGTALRRAFIRRTLEVVFDGREEAAEDAKVDIDRMQQTVKTDRQRLIVPPEKAIVDQLATTYRSTELGSITVKKDGARVILDVGEWSSEVAMRKNGDGSTTLVMIDPGIAAFEITIAELDAAGKRTLLMRNGQQEYVFTETK